MKALFVHDHKFKTSNSVYYTTGSLTPHIWERYLKVFKSLTVVGRDGGEVSHVSNDHLNSSSTEGVDFILLPNILTLKNEVLGNNFIKQKCRYLVKSHDAIIVRLPSKLGFLFAKEAIRQKKPYAVEVVGSAWDALWHYGNYKGKMYAPLMELQTRYAVNKAAFALYVTKDFLQKRYPSKGRKGFCSNVDLNPVDINILNQRISKINNMPKKTVVFGLIGNFSADYKGIDCAIRALAYCKSSIEEWELQIVGSGNPDKYLHLARELKVEDRVKFLGRLSSGKQVFTWLDTIDIYLQPSLVEGLPRALIEAMSRGCPALGSYAGGIPELLNNSQLSKVGSHTELGINIRSLSNNLSLMTKLANDNFNKAASYYKTELVNRRTKFWVDFCDYLDQNYN